jgi:DNA (cytosine-5)-methyltransferase 1
MTKPKVLDLFCGAGGASMGYYRAGFDVVGIDNKPHKDYPFMMIVGDVMNLKPIDLQGYDLIHASPPCQPFTSLMKLAHAQGKQTNKLDLLDPTRRLLRAAAKFYIIENVVGAPLRNPVTLCGSSFGLKVRRHRLFESYLNLKGSKCDHKAQGRPIGVYGSLRDEIPNGGKTAVSVEEAREAMGIDWAMKWGDLVEAIPPIYTEYLGKQALDQI